MNAESQGSRRRTFWVGLRSIEFASDGVFGVRLVW